MQDSIVNINGRIFGTTDNFQNAQVSIFDRGYLYGDSLYEVARSYQGEFFLLDDHLKRLEKSAELCLMKLGQTLEFYKKEIYRTFETFRNQPQHAKKEAYMRLIVSRGVGKIGFGLSCIETPTQYTIIIQSVEPPSEEHYKKGLKLKITERIRNDKRALDPAMKSGNYLNNLLAYLEATSQDFDDALLSNSEGHITEGTTFNIFYYRRGILATPPLDIGILAGITRNKIIQIASELKIPCREVRFPKERLYEAEEVFLSSSVKEIMAITQIDNVRIGSAIQGPITQKLHSAYRRLTQ